MDWYVLYTKPRMEKKVAEGLTQLQIENYCPMVTEMRQWSDRLKKVETPLFKSYVFVRLKACDRLEVFSIPGVVRYLFWLGKPAIVRDKEIDIIKKWLNEEACEEVLVSNFTPGDRIKIKSGAFRNKEGIVHKIGSKRMQLLLPELGCTISVRLREIA